MDVKVSLIHSLLPQFSFFFVDVSLMLIYWELNEWNEQHGQNKTFSNSLCGKSPLLVPFSIIIKFDKKSHPSLNECIEQRIRYKLRDMDGEKVQICMYRTYRGIIIISDYNSCNISYTIVDKYFLSLLHASCCMWACVQYQ